MWPWGEADTGTALRYEAVAAGDFEALLALRLRAMRPSLEALGRFDPERGRQRLAQGFAPAFMRQLMVGDERVGFTTLRPAGDGLSLELVHLYLEPAWQGRGLGARVLDRAKARADLARLPLTVEALQRSDANRFYRRHGFVEVAHSDWDIRYRREPQADPLAVVRALWSCMEARDWPGAQALLHSELQARWWASGERFHGAAAYIAVQAQYPEGWSLHPVSLDALDDGRVLAFVRVAHPPHTFLVQQCARVRDGLVTAADELWATCEAPPAWRTPERFAGLERLS